MFYLRKYGKYSAEFKEFVTKQIVLDGHKMTDVCQRLDIPYDTLQNREFTRRILLNTRQNLVM
ncbi:transposase [Fictibacillus sp. FJAT-27399]|uniref:transposase n=1 Tax=Fictibacillus sp. FJAT-27399 TaxID=1729689 RepID=UPI00351012B5